MKEYIKGANPYMPLWEHVPDGEPRVFEHNGEKRVYLYGSHDTLRTEYCGKDYVVWSAPVEDLTNWTCHGVCYESHYDSILYAPDVVKKGDTYYMYAAEKKGSLIVVATSKSPIGPFENPIETKIGFDPGVLVDDDGRIYIYWGFCGCYCAELNDDMVTLKEETIHEHPMGHSMAPWIKEDDGHASKIDAFFEASSPRKIMGKYVYIFSRRYEKPVPEMGVYEDCNGFLSYRISDKPLEGFHDGGDISFNGGEILRDSEGRGVMTYQWGNNHGSLMEVNGKWYIFYHRQTGTDEYSRQAMLEPVDIAMGSDGKLFIGDIKYLDGEPVSSRPVEMTSQGPHINGMDARKWISAGYACHIYGSKTRAYIKPVYEQTDSVSAPVVNFTSGTTVGFRYVQFGANTPSTVTVDLIKEHTDLTVLVRLDSYKGRVIASGDFSKSEVSKTLDLSAPIIGKHAVYFEFISKKDGVIGGFDKFTFD